MHECDDWIELSCGWRKDGKSPEIADIHFSFDYSASQSTTTHHLGGLGGGWMRDADEESVSISMAHLEIQTIMSRWDLADEDANPNKTKIEARAVGVRCGSPSGVSVILLIYII